MGGAGTAAGNDSAMPYLNPAGLAGLPGSVVGVSVAIHGFTQRTIGSGTSFTPEVAESFEGEVVRETTRSRDVFQLPGSVMYGKHWGSDDAELRQMTALSMVIPVREEMRTLGSGDLSTPVGTMRHEFNYVQSWTDYYFGLNHAIAFGDRVRVGVGLNLLYAERESRALESLAGRLLQTDNASVVNTSLSAQSFGLVPILGVQARLFQQLWAGVGVAVPSIHLTGRIEGSSYVSSRGADFEVGVITRESETSELGTRESNRPLRISAGLAWDDRESFSAALDVFWMGSRSDAFVNDLEQRVRAVSTDDVTRDYVQRQRSTFESESVFNVALGVEARATELLALRAGAFTDLANAAELDPENPGRGEYGRIRADYYGGSLGIGLLTERFDSTIGLVYRHGSGEIGASPVDQSSSLTPVDVTEHSLMLVVSGTVSLEEAQEEMKQAAPFIPEAAK